MRIFGAGIAGLLAGCIFQNARIIEARKQTEPGHKALLRFRSPAVGDALGIEFKRVRVNKGIWYDGAYHQPNILLANMYSRKVVGRLADRSIWNLDPVDRYIAPEDFIDMLIERCASRVEWETEITAETIMNNPEQAISTLPMDVMYKLIHGGNPAEQKFESAPIVVRRWRVPNANVYQTVYYPDLDTPLYRASITGDLLIAEYIGGDSVALPPLESFGIQMRHVEPIETVSQRYGKIVPIDNVWRKKFIYSLSTNYNIFSLGRFGTWRNLLLDDVLDDIAVVKRLMNSGIYDRSVYSAR